MHEKERMDEISEEKKRVAKEIELVEKTLAEAQTEKERDYLQQKDLSLRRKEEILERKEEKILELQIEEKKALNNKQNPPAAATQRESAAVSIIAALVSLYKSFTTQGMPL